MKLILSILFISLAAHSKNFGASHFFPLDPKGNYFSVPGGPARRITLSSIDPNLVPGSMMAMKIVGDYAISHESPDTNYYSAAVFVDANNSFLDVGPLSRTYPVDSIGIPADITQDFILIHSEVFVQVPNGAVAILVGALDSYYLDNEDPNGNYGVSFRYPAIAQVMVSQLPSDPDTDHVRQSEDASVSAFLTPNADVALSTVTWTNNTSHVQKVYHPNTSTTNSQSWVDFQISPVPGDPQYLGLTTLLVELRDSNNQLLDTMQKTIDVKKMKVRYKIFQGGVEAPDTNHDGIVELKPGVEAFLVVDMGLDVGLDVANSVVEWSKPNLPRSGDRTYVPQQGTLDSQGHAVFPFEPVPAEQEYAGINNLKIIMKRSDDYEYGEQQLQVDVQSVVYDIYQVVKNPKLNLQDSPNYVDLVGGKNADILVNCQAPCSAANTTANIHFGNYSHDFPGVGGSDSDGNVDIQISPIPKFDSGLTVADLTITTRTLQDVKIGERKTKINIRRTKPIRLGFVSIESPKETSYPLPDQFAMEETYVRGKALVELLTPSASSDFFAIKTFSKITGEPSGKFAVSKDRENLAELIKLNAQNFQTLGISRVVGLVSDGYYEYHNKPAATGTSWPLDRAMQIRAGWKLPLVHELGHTFCIRYDNRDDCKFIDRNYLHNPEVGEIGTINGYSNYDFAAVLGIPRGKQVLQKSLMRADSPNVNSGYWFNDLEYITVFKSNLFNRPSSEIIGNKLYLAGGIDENNKFVQLSFYEADPDKVVLSEDSGDFLVELKNSKNEILYSERYASRLSLLGNELNLNVNVPISADAFKIEISKMNGNIKETSSQIYVPTGLLLHKIQFIPDSAIVGRSGDVRGQILKYVDKINQKLASGDVSAGIKVLSSELYPYISRNLIDNFTHESLLDCGKFEIENSIASSIVRMNSILESPDIYLNSFVSLTALNNPVSGEKSQVRLDSIRSPEKEFIVISDVYFDGVLVSNREFFGSKLLASSLLSNGVHSWQVNNFLVPKKLWQSFDSAILAYSKELYSLQLSLSNELDPAAIDAINRRIAMINSTLPKLHSKKNDLKKEIDYPVILSFEVLQ